MEELLYPVGSVVAVENTDHERKNYLIIGHRVINHFSMRAWDYISVPYPTGLSRYFKSNKEHDYDDFFYFNHFEIEELMHKCDFKQTANEE